jgi:hypothetical protein
MKFRTLLAASLALAAQLCFGQDLPPEPWNDWAKWAEARRPVTDAQGHGPDIGSDEWADALARKLGVVDADGNGPARGSAEWRKAVEAKLKQPVKRELLSEHDTEARFLGVGTHRCMGRTSLCPDRCGHSGNMASFGVTKYLTYRKPGEYGDPKQERFDILIEDNLGNAKIPQELRLKIKDLKEGDLVHLKWIHEYIDDNGSMYPERNIVTLDKKKAD